MIRFIPLILAAAVALSGLAISGVALSGVAFSGVAWALTLEVTERYGAPFLTYAQVDRTDGSYRRMLTTPDIVAAAEAGQPLPDGARILMETYNRPGALGTVFHKEKVDGRWQYGSFNGLGEVDLATRPQASCLSCHATAAETDFTFTRPALDAAGAVGLSRHQCDRGGRRPCPLESYHVALPE